MNFGQALELLYAGKSVCRAGWNGKGMFLFIVLAWTYTDGIHDNYDNAPFICMKTVDRRAVPWLASQTDVLADDWEEVSL